MSGHGHIDPKAHLNAAELTALRTLLDCGLEYAATCAQNFKRTENLDDERYTAAHRFETQVCDVLLTMRGDGSESPKE
jgi:hypothetical protein